MINPFSWFRKKPQDPVELTEQQKIDWLMEFHGHQFVSEFVRLNDDPEFQRLGYGTAKIKDFDGTLYQLTVYNESGKKRSKYGSSLKEAVENKTPVPKRESPIEDPRFREYFGI